MTLRLYVEDILILMI